MNFTPEEVEAVKKTDRSTQFQNALVPHWVAQFIKKDTWILDYGSGQEAFYTKMLLDQGFEHVSAWDFVPQNVLQDEDTPFMLSLDEGRLQHEGVFDVVMASNVLNVQTSFDMLARTIYEITTLLRENGCLITNYPDSPRKILDLKLDSMLSVLRCDFVVVQTEKFKSGKIIICGKPHRKWSPWYFNKKVLDN